RVSLDGVDYFVSRSSGVACAQVLVLCKPTLDCPDCLADIRRLTRDKIPCQQFLLADSVADAVPATACVGEAIKRGVDDVELQILTARICLDTTADVQVGDLVICGTDVWRIDRIVSPCGAECLLTLQAVKEPWSVIDQTGPVQYLGLG